MPINQPLATLSAHAFGSAAAIYVLAMCLYLAEVAFGRRRAMAGAAAASSTAAVGAESRARTLVGAGGPETTEEPAGGATPPALGRGRPERLGRMAVALTVLGALMHGFSILARGLAVHRWPLGNLYECISFCTLGAIVAWLIMMRRFPVRRISGFVLMPILVLLFLNDTVFYTVAGPVPPALQSYWLIIHVTIISVATGILLVPGMASVMYLIRSANEANPGRLGWLAPKLPGKDALDRVAYRVTIFAFPLYTFGVICGAIWGESAWGTYWSWDPKETTAFIAWIVYAIYLYSRATSGFRGNRAAIINTLGFGVMLFNMFFINFIIPGMHSYAGLG
jgi:cytochrome c-type biogenesis protein CcsB